MVSFSIKNFLVFFSTKHRSFSASHHFPNIWASCCVYSFLVLSPVSYCLQLFDRVRNETKAAKALFDKIEAVEVNFERDDLGLEPALRDRLRQEVEVAFNLLASVNFNEALDQALETNVECTRRVLNLLSGARRIKSVIHVSTFYSNCNRTLIEEKIYDDIGFGGYDNIKSTFAKLQDDHKQFLSPVVLGTFPNSYTFSKKCAEVVVRDKFGHLPVGIFRPPIGRYCGGDGGSV